MTATRIPYPAPEIINLRGVDYKIENPTDFNVKAIGEYSKTRLSNVRRKQELASAVSSMIPAIDPALVSCRTFELEDGRVEIEAVFNLSAAEVLQIVVCAEVAYMERMLVDLKNTTTDTPEDSAKRSNQIAVFTQKVQQSRREMGRSALLDLATAASDAILQQQAKETVAEALAASVSKLESASGLSELDETPLKSAEPPAEKFPAPNPTVEQLQEQIAALQAAQSD